MRIGWAAALLLGALALPRVALAQDDAMTVGEFLDGWAQVEAATKRQDRPEAARAAVALMEPLSAFALAYKAQLAEDRDAGRPPRACPPQGREQKIDIPAFVAMLAALPPDRRDDPVEPVFFTYLDRRFPCPVI